jgi:hypothetical protein
MKLLNSSLVLLMGISAIASTAFVAIVDGAKSSKKKKSSKSSKSSSDDVAIVTETINAVFRESNLFAPPESFDSLFERRRLTNARSRNPRNQHERRLLENFTNNSKFMEKVNYHKKQRNLQAFAFSIDGSTETYVGDVVEVSDDGDLSPVDPNKFFTQICTIIDGDYQNIAGDGTFTVNNIECTVLLCTGKGDCLNLLLSGLGGEAGFDNSAKTNLSIVSGRGKYFGITGEAQVALSPEPPQFSFDIKYIPSTLSEALLAAVRLF